MHLQMIRYGLVAGLSFLLTVAALDRITRPAAADDARAAAEGDISEQVWHVLAEARRITQEAARGL
jgi:hypothetical protein